MTKRLKRRLATTALAAGVVLGSPGVAQACLPIPVYFNVSPTERCASARVVLVSAGDCL